MLDEPRRVRFAPSPTGSLHLGNARTAILNWIVARRTGGTFVVRVEDTDTERERLGSEAGILEDLRWLGLDWDEGPGKDGPYGPYRQSERRSFHDAASDRLLRSGHAYRCFCTDEALDRAREAMRARGETPRYPGTCAAIAPEESDARATDGEPFAVRFRIVSALPEGDRERVVVEDVLKGPVSFSVAELSDGILVRRDGRPTYNFAVVVDDATMAIDLVLRGEDHLSNTPRQVLLYRALGASPPAFAHIPMVRGPDGEKLSKRHGALSIAEYRARGYLPEAVVNAVALLGWTPRDENYVADPARLVRELDPRAMSKSPSAFDPDRLDWIAGQHFARAETARLRESLAARLVERGVLPPEASSATEWLDRLVGLVHDSVPSIDRAVDRLAPVFAAGGVPTDPETSELMGADTARRVVEALGEAPLDVAGIDGDAWKAIVATVKAASGVKGAALFKPLRVAITGEAAGPALDGIVAAIADGHARFPGHVPSLRSRVEATRAALPAGGGG